MKLRAFITDSIASDDRAVSPVIGVILMVAVTVILAATIGAFVLNFGQGLQTNAPQSSFTFEYADDGAGTDNDELTVTYESGEQIDAVALDAAVSGATDSSGGAASYTGDLYTSGDVTAGASDALTASDFDTATLDLSGATVRVVWSSDDGESSTLQTWSGPDA